MKKRIILIAFAVIMACLVVSADAYIIKLQGRSPDGSAGSPTGQISDESNSFTPHLPPLVPEPGGMAAVLGGLIIFADPYIRRRHSHI